MKLYYICLLYLVPLCISCHVFLMSHSCFNRTCTDFVEIPTVETFKFGSTLCHAEHFSTQPVDQVREDLVLELAELSHGSGGSTKGFEEADVLSSLAT